LTDRLTEDEKWERGRFVEFLLPRRGIRVGRILRTYSRGSKKDKVTVGIFNPYTKLYGNRGGFRHYTVTIDKKQVLKFFRKTRSASNGNAPELATD
jgi:hypothetical protein